jgi:serine/threonine protein kinase
MKTLFKFIVLMVLLTVGGLAFFVHNSDQQVVILKDGTIIEVDAVWESESGALISYEFGGETILLNRDEIRNYGKRTLNHIYQQVSRYILNKFEGMESILNRFFKKNNISVGFNLTQYIFLLGLLLFLFILFFTLRSGKKKEPKPEPEPAPDLKAKEAAVHQEVNDGVPTRMDVVGFFLNLFKQQIGADPDAPVEYVPLMSKSSGPNHIYELRVKHMSDWATRRMTIGPLGEESGSKSKCYYVIYDVHMVVKVPAKPVTDFEQYIESIKKEADIVNKLIPKECIIPKVSVVLDMISSNFPEIENIPADNPEEKYIEWMRKHPEYQKFLRINNTFVYIMDLSKYYFLSHILDELHDIKHLISREITENGENIWEPATFKGRYGTENDAIFEIRDVFNRCAVNVRRLVDRAGITATVSDYQIQSWFISHLADGQISANGNSGFPEQFIHDLNRLIKKTVSDHSRVVGIYRKTIKDYVYLSFFEQNKAQMTAITTSLLDVLAWFRKKRVSMRDLKPDNLFVAGDPARYPMFLRSAEEFSMGIIDVETAVDFERSKHKKMQQPLLGGTPFYATPSHFIKNDMLIHKFGGLGRILHLQDWHATLVMIYKVITGELLFDQTAKLFGDLRNMMIQANQPAGRDSEVFEDASRMFWHSAVVEFKGKMEESEKILKSIAVALPESVQYMFGKVLTKELRSIALSIKSCVDNQNIFVKGQIREVLLKASHSKVCQLKADLESKTKPSENPAGPRTEAIAFLHKLSDLKAQFVHHAYMQKRLSKPEASLSAHDILTFMFNVMLNNMYRSEWKPLCGEAIIDCELPNDETIIEDSV